MRYIILLAAIPLTIGAYYFGASLTDTQAVGILSALVGVTMCGAGALGLGVLVLAGLERATRGAE